jgi:branched-chain amino acid aminotransferase
MKKTSKIWMDRALVPWDDAKIHVMTHSLHYGTGIFEGIRCYKNERGRAIFRLADHVKRLFNSAKIYQMPLQFSPEEVSEAIKDTIRANKIEECYIRPIAYYGDDEVGLNPLQNKTHLAIAVWPWLPYLGIEGMKKGVRCKISSWARIDPRVLPTTAKSSANYANSALAKMEAVKSGYDEAIILNVNGFVTEGSGENIFVVRDDELITPPLSAGILPGITRDSVIKIGKSMGMTVLEENISRGELWTSEEAFFTGTAAEITPIREVDDRIIGDGHMGKTTAVIQSKFFDVVRNSPGKFSAWLEFV